MIEVFKTDVQSVEQSKPLIRKLKNYIPGGWVNFDLEDCDKVLRVEGSVFSVEAIIKLLHKNGHHCEILD
ncbi:hypothetical protein [Mucilaginibacter aquariorum]|uniref:Uncharacterized protein n=1 Tax=Mucilaginibacter aquariorum TaxID=2967225 RepID=A0ABT1SY87_9SPHI|nr:hypothetical protein [Mucilaginibacter aquariorum]MCQ6957178.1 hypothetical protein [Mucilaginibacter aquariorum]